MVIPQMVLSLIVMNPMGSQSVQKSPTKQTKGRWFIHLLWQPQINEIKTLSAQLLAWWILILSHTSSKFLATGHFQFLATFPFFPRNVISPSSAGLKLFGKGPPVDFHTGKVSRFHVKGQLCAKTDFWDVLLVLRINGLFHPYIKVGWFRPANRWNKLTY